MESSWSTIMDMYDPIPENSNNDMENLNQSMSTLKLDDSIETPNQPIFSNSIETETTNNSRDKPPMSNSEDEPKISNSEYEPLLSNSEDESSMANSEDEQTISKSLDEPTGPQNHIPIYIFQDESPMFKPENQLVFPKKSLPILRTFEMGFYDPILIKPYTGVLAFSKDGKRFHFRTFNCHFQGVSIHRMWIHHFMQTIQHMCITRLIIVGNENFSWFMNNLPNKCTNVEFYCDAFDELRYPCRECDDKDCIFTKSRLALRRMARKCNFHLAHQRIPRM